MPADVTCLERADLRMRFDPADRIPGYCELLHAENERINLVSRETSEVGLENLALDSLVPLAFLEDHDITGYLDIGSGGGLPALPLLLSGRIQTPPESCPVLVERTQKKAAALQRISTSLGLRIELVASDLSQSPLARTFDLITMRYVKLTPRLLAVILPLLSTSGKFVYYSHTEINIDREHYPCRTVNYLIDNQEPVRKLSIYSRR